MEHLPKLDGIRTIAVFLVIISHYFDFGENANLGYLGVNLFFFLSGYLITSLLMRDRNRIDSSDLTIAMALKNFYIRRSLRIFPLYYLVIIFLFIIGDGRTGTHVRQDIGYYGFYIVNIKYYLEQSWDGIASHFWSLSVEEQYYLFWPFIFFICPKKWLRYSVILVGFICIIYKVYLTQTHESKFNHILLATCAYKFCLGSLLTLSTSWMDSKLLQGNKIHLIFILATFAYICTLIYPMNMYWFIQDLCAFGLFLYLLMFVRYVNTGFWHYFLSHPVVKHMGLISYGIYVYHLIIPWIFTNILKRLGGTSIVDEYHLFYPLCILGTIAVSHFSYFYFEKYFLKLKSRFSN
jgi:peptidoglycan/LPS O-acetylase OafA/YrhL